MKYMLLIYQDEPSWNALTEGCHLSNFQRGLCGECRRESGA